MPGLMNTYSIKQPVEQNQKNASVESHPSLTLTPTTDAAPVPAGTRTHQQLQEKINQRSAVRTQLQLKQRLNQKSPSSLQFQKNHSAQSSQARPVAQFFGETSRQPIQLIEPFDTQGKNAWDEKIDSVLDQISQQYDEQFSIVEVEIYLEDEAGIENPRSPYFELDNQSELDSYVMELESVEYEDVYNYWYGDDEESERDENILSDEDEAHYSSEDDEVPEEQDEFNQVIAVIHGLNSNLESYLQTVQGLESFEEQVQKLILEITKFKQAKKKTFPKDFNPVAITHPTDWLAFSEAIRHGKKTPKTKDTAPAQKPTVYDLNFQVWPKAKYQKISFRGKQLKDPYGKAGRSWPALAMSLHQLALKIGKVLAAQADKATGAQVGNRSLATAMLFVFAGRGEEVQAELKALGLTPKDLEEFEATVLEFFALASGIETIRLPFAQFDTLFHLSNIAQGQTFGKQEKPYNFLNVFSSVRDIEHQPKHVFVPGVYGEKRQELTKYGGFTVADLSDSLLKPSESEVEKSKKSVGKSLYTHSAGHTKVEKLLAGDKSTITGLFKQIKPVGSKENRRTLHEQRLFHMGPIRVYNLIANLLRRHQKELAELPPEAVIKAIFEVYSSFLEGTKPDSSNPFRNDLPTVAGPDFSASLTNILQEEEIVPINEELVGLIKEAFTAPNGKETIQKLAQEKPKELQQVLAYLVHEDYSQKGESLLHLAIRLNDVELVKMVLKAGVDLHQEDKDGITPLALALSLDYKEIFDVLTQVQEKQVKAKGQLPKDWAKFKGAKINDNWLTDQEVRQGLQTADLPAQTHIAPAVDLLAHPDALAEFIRDDFLDQTQHGAVLTYTIVPINFSNAHWATLIIQQNPERRSQPFVYFFDSLGSSRRKRALLQEMLRMTGVYTRVDNITDLSATLQDDGFTCGTWVINAATTIVRLLDQGSEIEEIQEALRNLKESIQELHQQNLNLRDEDVDESIVVDEPDLSLISKPSESNVSGLSQPSGTVSGLPTLPGDDSPGLTGVPVATMTRVFSNPPKSFLKRGATLFLGSDTWQVTTISRINDEDYQFTLQRLGSGLWV